MRNLIRRSLLSACLLAGALFVSTGSNAHAQGNLSFSGGLGAPVTLTLSGTVSYAVTAGNTTVYGFIFQAASPGQTLNGFSYAGNVTFSVNGAGSTPITSSADQFSMGSSAAGDLILYTNSEPAIAPGDTVTLTAGTLTSAQNDGSAPPANGTFNTFVINSDGGIDLSANGVSAAPEPGTWAMLAVGGAAGLIGVYRTRRSRASA